MMQIKFNFNNFIFYGVCLPQLRSVPAAYAAAMIGPYNNDVILLRSLRSFRTLRYVLTFFTLRWLETPLKTLGAAPLVWPPWPWPQINTFKCAVAINGFGHSTFWYYILPSRSSFFCKRAAASAKLWMSNSCLLKFIIFIKSYGTDI